MKLAQKITIVIVALFAAYNVAMAKGADGVVMLNGTVQDVKTNNDTFSFLFSGKLLFHFFTAPIGDSSRKQIDLDFEAKKLFVSVSKFGTSELDSGNNQWQVTYKMAVEHALLASNSGEAVAADLFGSKFSYDQNGTIEKIECTSAQILPDSLLKTIHQSATDPRY